MLTNYKHTALYKGGGGGYQNIFYDEPTTILFIIASINANQCNVSSLAGSYSGVSNKSSLQIQSNAAFIWYSWVTNNTACSLYIHILVARQQCYLEIIKILHVEIPNSLKFNNKTIIQIV